MYIRKNWEDLFMNTLKKFIHYYGPYKTGFFIDLLCAAIISLVDLAYPQILRSATKTLFTQDKAIILQALPWIAIGLFMMYVIQSFCKYYVSCQGHIMGAKMERDMRQELFEHYEELSFSYYSQNNSGQMMSKLVSDLFDISEFAHHGPENLFISLVKIVGSFIFLFLINKKLALPLIVLVILMFLFSFRQNQKMQRTFMTSTQAFRIHYPESVLSSLLQTKRLRRTSSRRVTTHSLSPRKTITDAWANS